MVRFAEICMLGLWWNKFIAESLYRRGGLKPGFSFRSLRSKAMPRLGWAGINWKKDPLLGAHSLRLFCGKSSPLFVLGGLSQD